MRALNMTVLLMSLFVLTARGGALIPIDEESSLNLGFRLQPIMLVTESDLDGDGDMESETDFKLRRARLRLKASVTERIIGFMQTEMGSGAGGSGYDMRIIDAWVSVRLTDQLTLLVGENMAPANRQNMTSSGATLAIDRPGVIYKSLNWGTRSLYAFSNRTLADSDAGLRGEVDVRDNGVTLFASTSLSDAIHVKGYLGGYDGVQAAGNDDTHFTARAQLNLLDPEPGYYNLATYLGELKTVGIGVSYDTQANVAMSDDKGKIDYNYYSVDLFADVPAGPGTVTFEAAYSALDLDDAMSLDLDGDPLTVGTDTTRASGNGYYVQAGYYVNAWQPWVEFEQWNSDAADNTGSYDTLRVGLSYFFKGHNAAIKGGYEQLNTDTAMTGTTTSTIDSFLLGCYLTY